MINKRYVDERVQGLKILDSVKAATTENLGTFPPSGTIAFDGVTVHPGDRVLVKNQTDTTQNGIWLVATPAWIRATDADITTKLLNGYVFVEQGTTQEDTGWTCSINPDGTVGLTPITWTQFSGAGNYIADETSLTKIGNRFEAKLIPVNKGGTGETSYTNGQILIGNTTGNTLVKSTLTQGLGITITNGPGTITIANSAPHVATNLSVGTVTATAVPINSSTGTDITTLPAATATLAGIVVNGAQEFGGVKTFTSPSIKTSLTTPSSSFALLNENATTISAFGAATNLTLGSTLGTFSTNINNVLKTNSVANTAGSFDINTTTAPTGKTRLNYSGHLYATEFHGPLVGNADTATHATSATSAANATTSTHLKGGNNTTLLGSIPYQVHVNATTMLPPNTSTTVKYLRQVGDGTKWSSSNLGANRIFWN